jgi:hypothetical protein
MFTIPIIGIADGIGMARKGSGDTFGSPHSYNFN